MARFAGMRNIDVWYARLDVGSIRDQLGARASGQAHEALPPVGSFPANGFGLSDVCGNVWEWTCDTFAAAAAKPACCVPSPAERFERKVIKGGSHLCAPNYCLRYRPAARQGEAVDTSTSHIGFRCVLRRA